MSIPLKKSVMHRGVKATPYICIVSPGGGVSIQNTTINNISKKKEKYNTIDKFGPL
jgi:hypothetical protein